MPPRGLLVEEEDPRVYAPVRPTVLEQQIRDGLLRAGQPFRKDAEASYRSKLSKKARTGDQFEALRMGLMASQDFLGGAAQAAGAPITSAISTAMPAATGAWGAVRDTAPGREIEKRATGILGAWDTATGAVSDATGYPKDYASEAMLTGLMAATPAMARGAGKIADGAEDLARRYGYTFRRDPATIGMFAGPMALTADKAKLKLAQELAEAGLSRDEIWAQTGWFKGVDGKWRFEIDDSGMAFNFKVPEGIEVGRANRAGLLEDVVRHDKLFEAYPQLRQAGVHLDGYGQPNTGSWNGKGIWVGPATTGSRRLSSIAHEIQHAVQDIEGFAPGANQGLAGQWRQSGLLQSVGEDLKMEKLRQAGNVASRALLGEDEKFLKAAEAWFEGLDERSRPFTFFEPGSPPYREHIARAYVLSKDPEFESIKRAMDEALKATRRNDFETYRRIAGEVEARNVQHRLGLLPTPEYPRAAPWLTQDIPDAEQFLPPDRALPWRSMSVPKPAKASKSAEVFPELSKRYPETAPPVEMFDEAKGKTFLAKAMSGEAERFKRSRDLVVRDMEKNGYTPMFDPAKRYDADASLYAPHQSTVGQRMKKADTVAKYDAMARSPEAVDRWMRAYDTGMQFADDAGNWYHMGQLQDAFIKELGPVEGARAFKERFADGMAATTGGADPTSNLLMTHYGNQLKTSGAKWPEGAYEMPYPIGGRFATGNMEQHRKMLGSGGAGVTPDNPKRYNFSGNFLGNRGAATIDEQGMGLFDPKLTVPPPGTYGHWQGSVDDMAASRGVEPRWFQEVAWAGKKYTDTGGKFRPRPMISYVNEMIERTRRLTGETADQVLRRFIRGEGPMYGVAPAGLLALPQEEDPRQQ
jgi:hypothetical protein